VKVETWVAVIAALAAVGALYFNRQSTKAAVRAADAVEKQTEVQEQIRIDAPSATYRPTCDQMMALEHC
jgi:hypothetical protein